MGERIFVQGNEAVGWGAISAGCFSFFGYPITPQNEITEFAAREFPKRGGVFVQSQAETASINMVFGAAAAGVRVMTSTSSPGWRLMQEGTSYICSAEVPVVVVLVQRGGPGGGNTRQAQMDYISATKGGGGGGYKNIVLAPASVQETHDLMQLAFYLADKYRNLVIVLSEALIGQVSESLELMKLDFGPLPEKDWAIVGTEQRKSGKRSFINGTTPHANYVDYLCHLREKYQQMESEVRHEEYMTEDAELILVAFGYCARVSKEAVNMARAQGLKVGLLRPITLWPFPSKAILEKTEKGCKFLVVEDNLGQMVDDVKAAVECRSEVHLADVTCRHLRTHMGIIMPSNVRAKIKELV
ncbi:3-methyl-2-oxobutanoate dehydrogenase subunit VorB [Chloroflexota bacterium]